MREIWPVSTHDILHRGPDDGARSGNRINKGRAYRSDKIQARMQLAAAVRLSVERRYGPAIVPLSAAAVCQGDLGICIQNLSSALERTGCTDSRPRKAEACSPP